MTTEGDLKKACLAALGKLGVFAMGNAQSTTSLRGSAGLGKGSPDIVVVLPPIGVLVAIELKMPKGHVSEDQRAWQTKFEREGGQYFVCRSPQEVVDSVFTARAKIQATTRVVERPSTPGTMRVRIARKGGSF